ncbi:hypothetical protein [uncultured Chryseobacterium sp.]|uniref:hypothetical protein n=1 Tax=uncultured Chryseobacterium sp. TaxID=259322 RepID=UPI0025D0454F|nr:hypothetical protein [uncultured Chryseobacterium sp.]
MLDKVLEKQERWLKVYGKGRWTEIEIEDSVNYFKYFIDDIKEFNKENHSKNFIDIDKITIK